MAQITQSELHEIFDYDPESGFFYWKKTRGGSAKAGSRAGSIDYFGYIKIHVKSKHYRAHRLAWTYVYGVQPERDIDHINGVKTDNRISNLREATRAENLQNRDDRGGARGTNWHKATKKWQARICKNGEVHHLGWFDSRIDAHKAYLAAKIDLHTFQKTPRAKAQTPT